VFRGISIGIGGTETFYKKQEGKRRSQSHNEIQKKIVMVDDPHYNPEYPPGDGNKAAGQQELYNHRKLVRHIDPQGGGKKGLRYSPGQTLCGFKKSEPAQDHRQETRKKSNQFIEKIGAEETLPHQQEFRGIKEYGRQGIKKQAPAKDGNYPVKQFFPEFLFFAETPNQENKKDRRGDEQQEDTRVDKFPVDIPGSPLEDRLEQS
jgi:hypothetical protein